MQVLEKLSAVTDQTLKCELIQSWIEVQNGISANKLFVETDGSFEALEVVTNTMNEVLNEEGFQWRIRVFCVNNDYGVSIYCFNRYWDAAKDLQLQANTPLSYDLSNLGLACKLMNYEVDLYSKGLGWNEMEELKVLSRHSALTISTYASDILTQCGLPTVPPIINQLEARTQVSAVKQGGSNELFFEDKIDVNAYNFFESVHPAYAKQVVTTALLIKTYGNADSHLPMIDVGSGPGMPILMLTEMLPELDVLAVEPSEVAYGYLESNVDQFSRDKIKTTQDSFLDIDESHRTDLIVSTGSSHHFNTNFFFQKAHQMLVEDGVFIIADECISPFKNKDERKLNLLQHHTSYMLTVMENLDFPPGISDSEFQLVKLLKELVPMIAHEAHSNDLAASEHIARQLLNEAEELTLGVTIGHKEMSFYRLVLLELEALVAGLDYQVEQKTYPERLKQMAVLAGFEVLEHHRVCATSGCDTGDSGTHVIAFRKI